MQESDVVKFLMGLQARYPTFHIDNFKVTVAAWLADLEPYSVAEVAEAFQIYRAGNNKGFAPSVDQLLDCMHKVEDSSQMSAIEAWGCVSRAVRNSNYHAQEEFEKLPELIQKTVGSPSQLHSWAQTDYLVLEGTISKQFQYSYEVMAKRQREFNRYPANVQNRLAALTQSTLAALPQWENPIPVVTADFSEERASDGHIDEQMEKLRRMLN